MKFGKYFRYQLEETLPTWRDKYLDYKALKRLIRRLPPPQQGDAPPSLPAPVAAEGEEGDGQVVGQGNVVCFARFLDMELDKLDEFYMDREEWNIIRLQVLKENIERVKARRNNDASTIQEMLDIQEDFLVIRAELILLQSYSSLNFVGLVKILKKYDKRTGGVLSPPYTQRARHQPFFTTEPLTRLVQECEANLELLFPIIEGDLLVLQ